jgi:hypothetical protein
MGIADLPHRIVQPQAGSLLNWKDQHIDDQEAKPDQNKALNKLSWIPLTFPLENRLETNV